MHACIDYFILRLFRRKIVFIVKYFQRNHLKKKIIFSKIFFSIWYTRKNYKWRKCNCRQNPATFGCCCRIPAIMFGRIPVRSGRIPTRSVGSVAGYVKIRPTFDHGRIPTSFGRNLVRRHPATVAGCGWNVFQWPDVVGFQCRLDFRQLTIAGFWQLDIKHACKDQEFNFAKRFMVLKTVNCSSKN